MAAPVDNIPADARNSNLANATTSNTSGGTTPPPTAASAPQGNTKYGYVGLCDALNAYEQGLVAAGTVEIANIYEIQFVPQTIAASPLQPPGATDYSSTANQTNGSAQSKVNPNSNSVNMKSKNLSPAQGTQIVQFIEQTMRNSGYITQQLLSTDGQLDPAAKSTPNSASAKKPVSWFKIVTNAVPIGNTIDKKRNDFAYRITYTIVNYAINEAQSQYTKNANFRGVHKRYDYWFTGLNTQILNYEQKYNTQYFNVLDSKAPTETNQTKTGSDVTNNTPNTSDIGKAMGPNRNVPTTASNQSDQQLKNGAGNPASTIADFLYSQSDQATVKLEIIGDPAWLVQGEMKGIGPNAINTNPFYPDGSVNTEIQEIVFSINFNTAGDYNNGISGPYSGTGLMDIGGEEATKGINTSSAPAQASAAYAAFKVTNHFIKGKFTQELEGRILQNLNSQQINTAAGRDSSITNKLGQLTGLLNSVARVPNIINSGISAVGGVINSSIAALPVAAQTLYSSNADNSSSPISNESSQPAAPAEPPTSNGDINTEQFGPPPPSPEILLQNQLSGNGVTANVDTSVQIMAAPDA